MKLTLILAVVALSVLLPPTYAQVPNLGDRALLESLDPFKAIPSTLEVAGLATDLESQALRQLARINQIVEDKSALEFKLARDGRGASASLELGQVKEKGWINAIKRNPKKSIAGGLVLLYGLYELADDQGWIGGSDDSKSENRQSLDGNGILVENSRNIDINYLNGRGETDQLKIVNSENVQVTASDEPEETPIP